MYSDYENLGSLKSAFKKVKRAIEKVHPRELSPTRMLKKYSKDQKKKAAKKELARVTSAPKVPPVAPVVLPEVAQPFTQMSASAGGSAAPWQPSAEAPAKESSGSSHYLLIGAIAIIGAAILMGRKKK